MRKLTWLGTNRFEIDDGLDSLIQPLGAHDVLLNVKAVGICRTDIHIQKGRFSWARPPLVLGHEIAGVVHSVGVGVTRVQPGSRVTVDSVVGCGKCAFCQRGQRQFCAHGYELGITKDGGCQELLVIPDQNVYPVSNFVSMEEAAILDMEVFAAINKAGIRQGETVLIIGPGPAGLVATQIARILGAGKVLLSGTTESRLRLGLHLGADRATDMRKESISEVIREETQGMGVELVIDCAGTCESFQQAIESATRGGRVILYGIYPEVLPEARVAEIVLKDLTIFGSLSNRKGWDVVITWVQEGKLNLKTLITHRFPLEEGARAFDYVRTEPEDLVKAVILL